jgi:hypothetical protein
VLTSTANKTKYKVGVDISNLLLNFVWLFISFYIVFLVLFLYQVYLIVN